MSDELNPREHIGGNNPPVQTIAELLAEKYDDMLMEVLEAAARANKTPKEIADDASLASVGAIVVDVRELAQRVEEARKAEKEPHLKAGREVDAFFHAWAKEDRDAKKCGRLTRILDGLTSRMNAFSRSKVAASRAQMAAEAEDRRKQEEAARKAAGVEMGRGNAEAAAEFTRMGDAFAALREDAEAKATGGAADLVRTRAEGVTVSASEHWTFQVLDASLVDLNLLRPIITEAALATLIGRFVSNGGRELPGVRIYQELRTNVR